MLQNRTNLKVMCLLALCVTAKDGAQKDECQMRLLVTVNCSPVKKRQNPIVRIKDLQSDITEMCSGRVQGEPRLRSTAWKREDCSMSIHLHPYPSSHPTIVLQVGHYTTVFLCLYGGGGNTLPAFIAASDKYSWFSATAGRIRPFCL